MALTSPAGVFDWYQEPAKNLVQALSINRPAQRELEDEIARVFRRGIWLDSSRGSHLMIRVTDGRDVPTPEERQDARAMRQFRGIETSGEGMRCYVAICATLCLARRPLYLIDEPEMCLHPPQARELGRFIGRASGWTNGCVVVATHSSHVLRGMLETPSVSVVRLTCSRDTFLARVVDPETLKEAMAKPLSRSEAILDGLFASGVAVCEGEGDRLVYESAASTLELALPDIRFVPVGGLGGFRQTMKVYRALGVPTAAIGDLDAIARDELPSIVEEIASRSDFDSLRVRIAEIRNQIREIGSETSPQRVVGHAQGARRKQVGLVQRRRTETSR